jgi:hypothetical protein
MNGRPVTVALGIAILAMLALTVLPVQQESTASAEGRNASGEQEPIAGSKPQDPAYAGEAPAQQALTAEDRAQIQDLSARYAKALGGCEAEAYADLFVPGTGYFASNIRGEVVGRERLIALVRSERHCIAAPAANATPRPVPTVAIEASSKGVTGRADLGNAGYYDDEYVKTPAGWRIKARTVITRQEREANLTVQDHIAIRRLAGTDLGLFDDMYVAGPDGVKRFRTSGVALGLSAEGVTGRALLKNDGGYYEDVYVRTQQGGWRFKSRSYVAADASAAGDTRRPQP